MFGPKPTPCKLCVIKITGNQTTLQTMTINKSGLCNRHEALVKDDAIFETVRKFRAELEGK